MRAVKERIVRGSGFENRIDSREEHPANGNDRFLVPTTLFKHKVAMLDFGML